MKAWVEIERELRREYRLPEAPPAAAFAAEFQSRARDAARAPARAIRPVWPRWVLAGAGALALAAVLFLRPALPPAGDSRSGVVELKMVTSYESLFILQDEQHRGVIVWIDGAGPGTRNGS